MSVKRSHTFSVVGIALILSSLLMSVVRAVGTEDTTPPVIGNITVHEIGETWFTVSWTTDEPAACMVEVGHGDFITTYGDEPGFSTVHVVNVTDLKGNTDYECQILAADENGNMALSDPFTVTTYPYGWQERWLFRYYWLIIIAIIVIVVAVVVFVLWAHRTDRTRGQTRPLP